MASARVNAVWLQPVSTDPALFIDREKELSDLVGRLEEHREAQVREAHFLITGARGVGKSIFTRAALARFERAHLPQVRARGAAAATSRRPSTSTASSSR